MSAIFISHSSKDSAVAAETKKWLEQHRFRSLFLDFDPESGIPAGRKWEQELYRQLRACQAVVVLCSEASMSSDWCFVELTYARALGKHIFPMRIAPCVVRPPLTELQVIDAVASRPEAYQRLLQGLQRAGLENIFAWDATRPPYPGLMSFEESDAAVFFGRDQDIRSALDGLNRLRRFGGTPLVMYLGASGSGKSSLLRAGVLPRLKQNPEAWLVASVFRPLQQPIDEMAMALAQPRSQATIVDWNAMALALNAIVDSADPSLAAAHLMRDLRQASGGGDKTIVFAVDQFEEALVTTDEARRFLRLVAAIVGDPDRQAVIVATLRSDFLSSLQTNPVLDQIAFDTQSVSHLSADGLVQVIEGPAQVSAIEVETGLTQLMLADAATDDSLPLLAFTLRELWEHDAKEGRLSVATYRDTLGGLNGAIARAAEAVVGTEPLDAQQESDLQSAFLAMVRVNDAGQYTRQAVRQSDLPPGIAPLLERLIAARLLVSDTHDKERVVEVAHEALFRVWKRARDWLDADRDNLRLREGLRQAARDWCDHGRQPELLVHRGSRLEAIETLSQQPRFPLEVVQREYLQACIDAREAASAAQLRQVIARRRLVRGAIVGLTAGFLAVSVLAFWAFRERAQATDRLTNLHWVNAVSARDDDLKALHHFMQAFALSSDAADARNAFLAGSLLAGNASLAAILQAQDDVQGGAVLASDSTRAVTWSGSGTARVWDLRTLAAHQPPLHEGTARKVVPSPRGTRVTLWFGDDAIEVRDSDTGRALAAGPTHIGLPVFSDTETRLAICDRNAVKIWDQAGDTPLVSIVHEGVQGVALSRRGERALTWGEGNVARLWNVDTGEKLAEFDHRSSIMGAAISGDLARVLIWGKDRPVTLWNTAGARIELVSDGSAVPDIMGAGFFGHDTRVLTWNYGAIGVARVWDAASGKPLADLRHNDAIRNARFNRDEKLVLTWSDDGTARLWDGANGKQLALFKHDNHVRGALWSPDEAFIVTWSDDGSARVWDAASGQPASLPLRHESPVRGAAYATDGRSVLTWDERSARLWTLDTKAGRTYTLVHRDPVLAAAFTPNPDEVVTLTRDGRLHRWSGTDEQNTNPIPLERLVAASFDKTGERIVGWSSDQAIGIWSARNLSELVPPMHHERSDLGIDGARFTSDGTRVVSWGDDKTARVWDSSTGKLLALLRHATKVSGAISIDDNSQVLTWSDDRIVRLWNVGEQQPALVLPAHDYGVEGALLTRDKARIVTWDTNGTIRFWDAKNGASLQTVSVGNGTAVRGVRFSADENRVLAWDERAVRIWSHHSGKVSGEPVAWNAGNDLTATFNADESRVLTMSEEGLRLWSSRSGQPLSKWMTIGETPQGMLLDKDERGLLEWADTSVRIWNVAPKQTSSGTAAIETQQVRTGTRLGSVGQVDLISKDDWQKLRERIQP